MGEGLPRVEFGALVKGDGKPRWITRMDESDFRREIKLAMFENGGDFDKALDAVKQKILVTVRRSVA